MPTTPNFVYLRCTVTGETFIDTVRLFITALAHAGLPPVERWSVPASRARQTGSAEDALGVIAAAGSGENAVVNGIFELSSGTRTMIRKDRQGVFSFDINKRVGEERYGEMLDHIASAAEVCRFLCQRERLIKAALFRDGGGLSSTPVVPLVYTTSHLTVVTEQQVRDAYDDPDAFWQAGWDSTETCGERHLLTRGLDIEYGPEYLDKILQPQWAMARAAKPELTEYYLPQVEPEEQDIYKSGSRTLDIVGLSQSEKLIELTCSLDPGDHIQGWEIFDLLGLIEAGELPDGRKVDTVRVVFLECETARQEKRPLLDIGVQVHCYNDAGELIELKE